MRHVPDGTLRRLIDEPFAVADRHTRHAETCRRCRARSARFTEDAAAAQQLFDAGVPSTADARALGVHTGFVSTPRDWTALRARPPRRWRLMGASLSTGASIAAVGVVVAGVAAAATLTTVFAPTQVAPVPVSKADVQSLTELMGLSTTGSLGGFSAPSGSEALPFGTLSWTSSGGGVRTASLGDAETATGISVALPTTLPTGVGGIDRYTVLPRVTATIAFAATAGAPISGSSLVVTLGPGVAVSYSGMSALDGVGPLGILTVAQPIAASSGATLSEIENFLLSRPGVPTDLADEIRLLGNPGATLPIPTPPGVTSESTQIDGSPAVVLVDNSNAASGAIWADHTGIVHVVAGLLNTEDLLRVARQVG